MKRFFTIAMLATTTCLTLTVNATPASADTLVNYYPSAEACRAADTVLTHLSGYTQTYYCWNEPQLAIYRLMRVT